MYNYLLNVVYCYFNNNDINNNNINNNINNNDDESIYNYWIY
jgi:hypothetical protein